MSAKNILAAVLLLFVAGSLVAVALNRGRDGGADTGPLPDGVTVYYFHSKTRCPTCRSIESFAHEAVTRGFADVVQAGRMKWQVVNYELPENEHLVEEYNLVAPIVVLVRSEGGEVRDSKELHRVWELVDDREAFVEYVQEETRAMLGKPSTWARNEF